MKKNNYDFDLIISSEELASRKEAARILKEKNNSAKKKYKVRKWVGVFVLCLITLFFTVSIYQMFTIKTTTTAINETYTCSGKWIKVCSGSNNSAAFFGV